MYKIIQKRNIFLTISGILVVLSILAIWKYGFNYGIDFTGGTLFEAEFSVEPPSNQEISKALEELNLGNLIIQPVGENKIVLKYQNTDENKSKEILEKLNAIYNEDKPIQNNLENKNATTSLENKTASSSAQIAKTDKKSAKEAPLKIESSSTDAQIIEAQTNDGFITIKDAPQKGDSKAVVEGVNYESIGPLIGAELKRKSVYAILLVLVAILLYISWVFRKVSKPVASWKYGVAAIIALFHDVVIVLGVFAVLGHFYNVEINTPFIAAVLTVLGYSVNDTIVVFDRIRENLPKSNEDFEGTVNTSLNQTIVRSINTSLTVLLVLFCILIFGGSTIREFVLALLIGIFVGTYSSIFIASPILVIWNNRDSRLK